MHRKYDLKKMLEDLKEDESLEGTQERKLSQDMIQKMMMDKIAASKKEKDKG